MIYGYIRVSTDRQTVENQRYEIKRFCQENNLQVDKWISETISGAKDVDKRHLQYYHKSSIWGYIMPLFYQS